ncbi:hypothetical protein GCM10010206_18260 [Streptomyces cinerochromogenes]|nr:hypothetical protein GCM10010206_18260 [Streptomyces cinerochromogenes]
MGGSKAALRAELADGTVREAGFRWPWAPDRPAHAAEDPDLLARQVREPCGGAPTALAGVSVAMPATLTRRVSSPPGPTGRAGPAPTSAAHRAGSSPPPG